MVKKVLIFRPSLGMGGADRVTATLMHLLDRKKFSLALALVHAEGPFMSDIPSDVEFIHLDSGRLARSVPALTRVIRRLQPDVVFSTSSAANVIAAIAHRIARSKSRLVLSERSALLRGRPRDLKQRLEVMLKRVTYPLADSVTVVSSGLGDQLVAKLAVPRELIDVVYNPMIGDDFEELTSQPVEHPWFAPDAPPVILACARLVVQKDYPGLLQAFARIRSQTPARLFVLGEGALRKSLEARAAELGVADDVCFYGFDKNPMKYMARARLLMHASHTEGLPGAMIQTMACGIPVVATDCEHGPREVISHNVDGFLVPVGDYAGLAEHALKILKDDRLRDELGANARRTAQRFSVAASMARYENALVGAA